MEKKITNIFWGLLFVGVGVGYLGDALSWWGAFSFGSFFAESWWAMLVTAIGLSILLNSGINVGGLVVTGVGCVLLSEAYGDYFGTGHYIGWQIVIPVILIAIGIGCIFGKKYHPIRTHVGSNPETEYDVKSSYSAVFSGKDVRLKGPITKSFSVEATFGGAELHLEEAQIMNDITVVIKATFGGVEVYVPRNINVRTVGTAVFGGNTGIQGENRYPGTPTLTLDCTSVFGGVEVKER